MKHNQLPKIVFFSLFLIGLSSKASSGFKYLKHLPVGKIHSVFYSYQNGFLKKTFENEVCITGNWTDQLDKLIKNVSCIVNIIKDTSTEGEVFTNCKINGVKSVLRINFQLKNTTKLETLITDEITKKETKVIQTFVSGCK